MYWDAELVKITVLNTFSGKLPIQNLLLSTTMILRTISFGNLVSGFLNVKKFPLINRSCNNGTTCKDEVSDVMNWFALR